MAQSLEDLGALKGDARRPAGSPVHVQKLDKYGRAYATGKRKDAVARVWVKPGSGRILVNEKEYTEYFGRPVLQMIIRQPIMLTDRNGQFDVMATVSGGGLSGQAGALRHGISKALTYYEPGLRTVLKRNGFLTRDARVVERKKYGKRKGPPELPVLQALESRHQICEGPLEGAFCRFLTLATAHGGPFRNLHVTVLICATANRFILRKSAMRRA